MYHDEFFHPLFLLWRFCIFSSIIFVMAFLQLILSFLLWKELFVMLFVIGFSADYEQEEKIH